MAELIVPPRPWRHIEKETAGAMVAAGGRCGLWVFFV